LDALVVNVGDRRFLQSNRHPGGSNVREKDDGFTLIELLIVIVILGVLAGVVVFAINGVRDRAAKAACQEDRHGVEVALGAYHEKFNSYPPPDDFAALVAPGGFLQDVPTNPQYRIHFDANGVISVDGNFC
jgi:general secretion pathway protein G